LIASVQFPGSPRSYDYIAPFPVHVGMKVVVETRRGEAVVEVVGVKEQSEVATASLVRAEAMF
jgi:hypothetical protein